MPPEMSDTVVPTNQQGEIELFDLSNDELDRYPTGLITLDRTGIILRYNRAESALSRLQPHDVIGRQFFGDVAPCTAVKDFQGRFETFAAGATSAVERFDWVFMFRWGRQDVTVTLLRREKRPEIHVIVNVRSLPAPIPAAIIESIAAAERPEAPRNATETDVGIWADDAETNTTYRSEELHRILAAGAELETHLNPIVRYAHPKHAEALTSEMKRAYDQGRSYLLRTLIVAGDGAEKDVLVHGAFLGAPGTGAGRSIGSVVDLTQRRTLEDQLWNSAHLDPLTQLPNRRLVVDRLKAAIAAGESVAVCFLDLDKFKGVNDSGGHAVGDQLLRLVAERIVRATRPTDVVSRINGDEFVVIALNSSQPATVDALVGRILDSINEPYTIDGKQHCVSASAGIAAFPGDGGTAEELIGAADVAMYRAKASGPGSFRRFTQAMRELAAQDRERAAELTRAIDDGQIVAFFQPIVDARTRRIVGAEALARWEHPTLGMLPPAHFIALAEESGAIFALGERVLRDACTWGRRWFDALGEASPFVSVNVSPLQFRDRRFAATVREVLEATGLPPEKLELEFTESVVMDHFEETMLALADLKLLGISLSIDDFGTGYSALAYLKYFPIDTVKLDRAFVEGIGVDTLDESIVETIISLAQKLHLVVIAEGVETDLQARRLVELECDLLQGFLFKKPGSATSFDAVVLQHDDAPGAAPGP
ncbi:MAG: hypothetical protein NVSMB19_12110 [Vulcanimicrobiaceae bacterium]